MQTTELISGRSKKFNSTKRTVNRRIYSQPEREQGNIPFLINSQYIAKIEKRPDFVEAKLDLNELLIRNSSNSFLIRVRGDSMINAGIITDDILLVDCSLKPDEGKIVIAAINNELLVKKIHYADTGIELISENEKYPPLKVKETDKFNIWGVVTSVIKTMI
jgi:DNA polymerase V